MSGVPDGPVLHELPLIQRLYLMTYPVSGVHSAERRTMSTWREVILGVCGHKMRITEQVYSAFLNMLGYKCAPQSCQEYYG